MSAITKAATLTKHDERLMRAMQALGDENRYKIFKILLTTDELCVSEIAARLKISVPAVSQHFRTFELIGLVEKERKGQKICYSCKQDDQVVREIVKLIKT